MVSKIISVAILTFAIHHGLSNEISIQSDDYADNIIFDCLMRIIDSNFFYTPTIVISESDEDNSNGRYEKFYSKLIDIIFKHNIPRIINNDVDLKSMYVLKEHILSIKHFYNCDNILDRTFDPINEDIKYLLILFNSSVECATVLNRMSDSVSKYDITFLTLTADNNYDIITYIPQINITDCKMQYDVSYTSIATCDSKDKLIIFPNKEPQNIMRCPFRVGMGSNFPFAEIKNEENKHLMEPLNEKDVKGCDLETMKIMSEYFNFTLELYFIYKSYDSGENKTKFLDFLLNGTLDACAGGLYRIYGDIMEYSGVYGRQAFVWMYTVERRNRSWQGLFSKVKGLYIFIIFYFCFCMIWYLLCIYDKQSLKTTPFMLHGWGTLMGASSLHKANTLKHRIINIFYLIMCLHLTAYVNIQMYSFLTVIGPPTIYKTNEGIYKSNLRPFLNPSGKYFFKDPQYVSFANTSEDCAFSSECQNKSFEHNGATLVIDGQFIAFQAKTAINDEARAMKVPENMLTVYHEMLIRSNVSIIRRFQKTMIRLGEAGINDRLYHEALGILTEAKAKTAAQNIISYSYSCGIGCRITLTQGAGAFYIWLIGCSISVIAFVVEICSREQRRRV